uniref:SMYD family member 5 n=1 Tax=Pavo cristatus TaxID=9049 RepID=A0A8C9FDE2_PAVCR
MKCKSGVGHKLGIVLPRPCCLLSSAAGQQKEDTCCMYHVALKDRGVGTLVMCHRALKHTSHWGIWLCFLLAACDHCLRALETAEENAQRLLGRSSLVLPHPEQCSIRKDLHQQCPRCQVTYCSAECRQAALEQYHQVLCLGPSRDDPTHPLNKLQEAWRNMHYPPETSSIMLMARMVATVKQAKDKDWWIKAFSQFCSKTANEEEEIAHKLLGDKFKGQLELLRLLFTEALYDEQLSRWFTPEGFRSLFALVGTNGQGIGTSSLSQWVHACDALDLPMLQREELDAFIDQLYKDIEKGNHSCIPNAETSFPDNNFLLHLTALEDIEAGEVRHWGADEPEVTSHLSRGPHVPYFPHRPQPCAFCLLHYFCLPVVDSHLILCGSCQTLCFHLAFGGTSTNCCFGFIGRSSQPALFLFAHRKSASVI